MRIDTNTTHFYMRTRTHTHTHTNGCLNFQAHTQTRVCTSMHTHTHAHMHIYVQVQHAALPTQICVLQHLSISDVPLFDALKASTFLPFLHTLQLDKINASRNHKHAHSSAFAKVAAEQEGGG